MCQQLGSVTKGQRQALMQCCFIVSEAQVAQYEGADILIQITKKQQLKIDKGILVIYPIDRVGLQ